MKNLISIGALIVLLITACTKNQNAVRKLDGKWIATSVTTETEAGFVELINTENSFSMNFEACPSKREPPCDVIIESIVENNKTVSVQSFKVLDDGKLLQIIRNDGSYILYEIYEVNRISLTLKRLNNSSGNLIFVRG